MLQMVKKIPLTVQHKLNLLEKVQNREMVTELTKDYGVGIE
jgi:hypothetical protein